MGGGVSVVGEGLLTILDGGGGGGGGGDGGAGTVTVVALVTVLMALIVVLFVAVAVAVDVDLDAVGVAPPIKPFTIPLSPLPTFPTRPPTSAAAILWVMLPTVLFDPSTNAKQVDCCTNRYAA